MMIHEELLDSRPNDNDWLSPGDQAVSCTNYVWVVEKLFRGRWEPTTIHMTSEGFSPTVGGKREYARAMARDLRARGHEVRVVPYKACFDTKCRTNRQVKSERLDY